MNRLSLYFSDLAQPELIETRFGHEMLDRERRAVRGKSAGAYYNYGSFQWTSAVKGLVELLLKAAITPKPDSFAVPALLIGQRGSRASSLDYALSKEPNWLDEMFGSDKRGAILAKRFISRSNPDMKRRGPVALSLNERVLAADSIKVYVEDREVECKEQIATLLQAIH